MRIQNTLLGAALFAVFSISCSPPMGECKVDSDCALGQQCSADKKCVGGTLGGGIGGGTTGGGTTGGGTTGGGGGGGTGGGTTGGGGGDPMGGGSATGGGGGDPMGGGSATGGGGGDPMGGGSATGGGGGDPMGGGSATGGGGGSTGGGGGSTGGGGGSTGGGGGSTGGGGGNTGGGGGSTGGGGGSIGGGGGGGSTGGGGGSTGGGGGSTGGGGGSTGGGGGTTGGGGGTGGGNSTYASDLCSSSSPVISTNLTLTGESLATATNDYQWSGQPNCTVSGSIERDVTYNVLVPAGQRITVIVTPTGSTPWDTSIQLAAACTLGTTNTTCVAGVNVAGAGAPDRLTWDNPGSTAAPLFLLVDTFDAFATTYDISFTFGPIPQGDVCASAFMAMPGNNTGSLTSYANDYTSGSGCATGSSGPDNVWQTTVPAGNRLSATLSAQATILPDGGTGLGFTPTLNIVPPVCTSTLSCVAGSASTTQLTVNSTWDNLGTGPQTVFLVVDTTTANPIGNYALNVNIAPSSLPTGDVCTNTAAPITVDTMLTAQSFVSFASHWSSGTNALGCTFRDGPDRVYAVTIPANSRLTATGTSSTNDLSLNVVDGPSSACAASPVNCAARADSTTTGGETLRFDNPTGAAKTIFLIVDRGAGTPSMDTFDLAISLAMLPPNTPGGETCAMPTAISANTTIFSNTSGMVNDFAFTAGGSQCRPNVSATSTAPDAVYSTTIPPSSRLTVTLTSTFDSTINVIASPATNCGTGLGTGIVCLGGADSATVGAAEVVNVTNTSATPQTVFIVIDGYDTVDLGSFELRTATATVAGYTESSIPQACRQMSGSTHLLSATTTPVISDEAGSATLPLPIPFTFFGTPITHYAVSNNGQVQFFTAASGVVDTSFSNTSIPNLSTPNGFATAFWDDLFPSPAGTTVIHTLTTGVSPNRVTTIEWFDTTFYQTGGGALERLTFQVQLYEQTNVIEFHHCTLALNGETGTRLFGSSATVGVEAINGVDGTQHSSNTANSVNTSTAIRLTP